MPSVYIETTIPSFYHESRQNAVAVAWRAATRAWWDHHRMRFEICTSAVTMKELTGAPIAKRLPALAMLNGVPMLDPPSRMGEIVAEYIKAKLMPRDSPADAAHVAMCALHGIDFLLTWNIKHLANPMKQRHLEAVHRRLGLDTPIIITPYALLPEE